MGPSFLTRNGYLPYAICNIHSQMDVKAPSKRRSRFGVLCDPRIPCRRNSVPKSLRRRGCCLKCTTPSSPSSSLFSTSMGALFSRNGWPEGALAGVVTIDKEVIHGLPCLAHTRVPVQTLIDFWRQAKPLMTFWPSTPFPANVFSLSSNRGFQKWDVLRSSANSGHLGESWRRIWRSCSAIRCESVSSILK